MWQRGHHVERRGRSAGADVSRHLVRCPHGASADVSRGSRAFAEHRGAGGRGHLVEKHVGAQALEGRRGCQQSSGRGTEQGRCTSTTSGSSGSTTTEPTPTTATASRGTSRGSNSSELVEGRQCSSPTSKRRRARESHACLGCAASRVAERVPQRGETGGRIGGRQRLTQAQELCHHHVVKVGGRGRGRGRGEEGTAPVTSPGTRSSRSSSCSA